MIEEFEIENRHFKKTSERIEDNKIIAQFYSQMSKERLLAAQSGKDPIGFDQAEKFANKSSSIRSCGLFWDVDDYRLQRVKDIQRVNLCHSKFCKNCQEMLAIQREAKYTPKLDDLCRSHDIWHITFTIPNVTQEEFLPTLRQMFVKFPYLIRYFKGVKAKFLGLTKFGFVGAIRTLEITVKKKNGERYLHPHFHCLFVLKKGLDKHSLKKMELFEIPDKAFKPTIVYDYPDFEPKHINLFSYNNRDKFGKPYRFSDFEILLQKVWYLLINDIEVTSGNIENLKIGYSVKAVQAEGHYHQSFKYATEGKIGVNSAVNFETFELLDSSLLGRKVIQGYGCLNKFKFDDEEEISEEVLERYLEEVKKLKYIEEPLFRAMTLAEILQETTVTEKNQNPVRYISKNMIRGEILSEKNNRSE